MLIANPRPRRNADDPRNFELPLLTTTCTPARQAEPYYRTERKRQIEPLSGSAALGRHRTESGGRLTCARGRPAVHVVGRPRIHSAFRKAGRTPCARHPTTTSREPAIRFRV